MYKQIGIIAITSCLWGCLGLSVAKADWGPTIEKPPHYYLPYTNCSIDPIIVITDGVAVTARVGQSQSFGPIDSSNYSYNANQTTQTKNLFGVMLGVEFQPDESYEMQLGLSYYQASNFSFTGTVTQGVDPPSSNTFNYSYNMSTKQILAEGKVLFNFGELAQYHPYFSAGLGESFNHTSEYTVSNPPFLTFSPMFGTNNNTSFSYALGLGIDLDLTSHWRLGGGYRFSDLGKADLGSATIDTTPIGNALQQDHVYVNELIAQLTFLF